MNILGHFGKHVAYVLIAYVVAHSTGLCTIIEGHFPKSVLDMLSAYGINVSPSILCAAGVNGLLNVLEKLAAGK